MSSASVGRDVVRAGLVLMRKQVFNGGRWQMHRERCQIADQTPMSRRINAAPISGVLAGLMKTFESPVPTWFRDIMNEWPSLAGPLEAKHARPGRFQDGTMVVFVDGAVWLNELKRYWRTAMLGKLQARFGAQTIRKLVLQPDPDLQG